MFLSVFATSCDKDDDDDNNTNNNPPANEVSLSALDEGEGAIASTGDTTIFWNDTARYEYYTSPTSGGTSYDRWRVEMPGVNEGDELEIFILQVDDNPSENDRVIPEDGTYEIGGSMVENDVTVRIGPDAYYFRNSSVGSLTLMKEGEVWNIELNVEGLESGGIGEVDKVIDIDVALKAIPD